MLSVQKVKNLVFVLFLIVTGFIVLNIPYFNYINTLFLDQLQTQEDPRKEIVLITIDDISLQNIGAWPWNREVFAKAFNNLNVHNPRVVGIDVLFLEEREGDNKFQASLKDVKYPLILSSKLIDKEILLPKYNGEQIKDGYINFHSDNDGKVRSTFLTTNINNYCYSSFSFSLYKEYTFTNSNISSTSPEQCNFPQKLAFTNIESNNISFYYTNNNFKKISFIDLYKGNVNKTDIENKIILVGSTATDLKSNLNDNFIDINGKRISGVEIHANIVNTLLNNKFQKEISRNYIYIYILSLTFILLLLYSKIHRYSYQILVLVSAFALSTIGGLLLYEKQYNFPFIQIYLYTILLYIGVIAYKYFLEYSQKEFIKKAFYHYLNPQLLQKLMDRPELLNLGGEKRPMTVLFSDIRGFTTLSEKLSPEQLVDLLNNYLDTMSKVILEHNGTIDKFIGDAIMAFWNAPLDDSKHAYNSVTTSLSMEQALKEFNDKYNTQLAIGIGINTGDMVVGNIGSSIRFDYTVLGDNVNLASRLEGLTKKYHTTILLTEDTKKEVENAEKEILPKDKSKRNTILFLLVDTVIVKGKTEAVNIYTPFNNTLRNRKIVSTYNKAFIFYQTGDFLKAKQEFNTISHIGIAQAMLERIEELQTPPKDWNGVWKWLEK